MRTYGEGLALEPCSPLLCVVLECVQIKMGGKYPRTNDRWSIFLLSDKYWAGLMTCRLSVIRVCAVSGLLLRGGLSSYKGLRIGIWL